MVRVQYLATCLSTETPILLTNPLAPKAWHHLSESLDRTAVAWYVVGTTIGQRGRPPNTADGSGSGGVRHSPKCIAQLLLRLSRSPLAPPVS